VSILVVYTFILGTGTFFHLEFILVPVPFKLNSQPSDFQIQFLCICFILSGQSSLSTSDKSLSAYLVIAKTHCLIFFFSTFVPHLSQEKSFNTSSFASPVLQDGQ
jgi:hypothetical protein